LISRKPISRESFDDKINDATDSVYLWISSGLDFDFYRPAFPGDVAETTEKCEVILRTGMQHMTGIQQVRLDYVSKLVLEIISKSKEVNPSEGLDLGLIHEKYYTYYWRYIEQIEAPIFSPLSSERQALDTYIRNILRSENTDKFVSTAFPLQLEDSSPLNSGCLELFVLQIPRAHTYPKSKLFSCPFSLFEPFAISWINAGYRLPSVLISSEYFEQADNFDHAIATSLQIPSCYGQRRFLLEIYMTYSSNLSYLSIMA
jgi:hypothetical protein